MQEQETKLQQEILQDARHKAERTVERAHQEAERSLQAVRSEQARAAEALQTKTGTDARARARSVLASIQHDVHKQWLRRRETVLDQVLGEALQRAEQGTGLDRRRSLFERLAEALAVMGSDTPVAIAVSAQDAPFLDAALLAAVARQLAAGADAPARWSVAVDPELASGFVLSSADGRRRFDQTFAARLARLKGGLRQVVAAQVGAETLDVAAIAKECQPHE